MSHLVRAGALLLTALSLFVVARYTSTQQSFEVVGLVKGNNAAQWASLAPKLGASELCVTCHQDVDLEWSRSPHTGQSCESCHGVGERHINFGAIIGVAREICTTCHATIPGRPEYFAQVDLTSHYDLQACTDCHNPHSPAATYPDIPHRVRGREDCLACHGGEGILELPPNHADRPVEICLGCHKPGEGTPQ